MAMTPEEEELMQLVRRIVRESELPRALIARDAHIGRASLNAWLAGERKPRGNSLFHLAHGLERRAEVLQALAAELKRIAERKAEREGEG